MQYRNLCVYGPTDNNHLFSQCTANPIAFYTQYRLAYIIVDGSIITPYRRAINRF